MRFVTFLLVCSIMVMGCGDPKPQQVTIAKNAYTIAFEEGKEAGKAGLSIDLCPYPLPEPKSGWYIAETGERRIKWLSGYNAGTIEKNNKTK